MASKRIAAVALGVLAFAACSKTADSAGSAPAAAVPGGAKTAGGGPGDVKPGAPGAPGGRAKAPPGAGNPFDRAVAYECVGGGTLKVVFNTPPSSVMVKFETEEGLTLPRKENSDMETYGDGRSTLGVRPGAVTFTEAPGAPKSCHSVSKDLPAPRTDAVVRNVTIADKDETVEMKVGEKISISLVGVPTAGYVWAAQDPPAFVKVSAGKGGPTSTDQLQPGFAGGNHWEVNIVEGVKPGDADLVLVQRRPWENKATPDADRFKIHLKVK